MGNGLSTADLATRTFTLAAIYQQASELHSLRVAVNNLQKMMMEFTERLDENFQLSSEQKVRKFLGSGLLTAHSSPRDECPGCSK